jgi:hypothetical protein
MRQAGKSKKMAEARLLSEEMSIAILIVFLSKNVYSMYLINAIFWVNVLLHIATVLQFNFEN